MKLRNISLSLLIFSGVIYPSQVHSHVGSNRACYDMSGSVERTSGIFKKGDPVPTYKGEANFGGGRSRKSLRCMHSGVERYKGPKGRVKHDACHSHFIRDSEQHPQGYEHRLDSNHVWSSCKSSKKCRKTP